MFQAHGFSNTTNANNGSCAGRDGFDYETQQIGTADSKIRVSWLLVTYTVFRAAITHASTEDLINTSLLS